MSWTVKDVISQARDIIQDTRPDTYRHSDEKLIGIFNAAMSEVWRLRPDAFISVYLGSLWEQPPIFSPADMSATFPLDGSFFQSVVYYVAGQVGLGDDEFATAGRAMTLLQTFERQLVGGATA